MKEIPLTQGQVTLVDDEDYNNLMQHKWFAIKHRGSFYAGRQPDGPHKGRKIIFMHRYLMDCPASLEVDHKDLNKLNNQRSNLRICTRRENSVNIKGWGKSIFLGVEVRKSGSFHAKIRVFGKRIYLGAFKEEEAAARAYDEAAKIYHGEFANLNFKEECIR